MSRVASLGCIISNSDCCRGVEVHHKTGAGMGLKSSNYDVIPLCANHHRTGGYKVAIHAGTKTWESIYGTQDELIERVKQILEE